MARLIKLANRTKPMIKLSSQEWLNAGINRDLFYVNEDGTIKVAQFNDPTSGTTPVIGAATLIDENQAKLKDPVWQKALGDYRGKRVPQGFSVVETAPGSGIFGLKNNATGKLNMPGRGNQNLAAALNVVGRSSANSGVVLPNPTPPNPTPPNPTPPNPDPNQTPKPTDWARRAKLLGAGLAGGAAGYYGTGAIADALQTNNNLKDPNRAKDFYRGAASLQQSVSPILGISKSLNKTVQEMMRTIADLQVQFQKTQPMMASPTLQRQNAIMSAAEAKNTLPSQGADYLPQ